MRVIHPPNQRPDPIPDFDHTVVFLAGPIQGAPDWQKRAVELFEERDLDQWVICNPRAPGAFHGDYEGQVDWELEHLRLAASSGIILFWLACPDPDATVIPGRAYAQTSRFELGEWVGFSRDWGKAPFVLGIQPGFSNERYIRRRISHLREQEIPDTLERTVELAIRQAR